jgi:hypothetical protein
MIRIRTEISADAKHFECVLSSISYLDPDSNLFADPDPGRPTFSLLGWMFLPEPEYLWRDPTFSHPGSRTRIKEFKYFNHKKCFLISKKYDPGCSYRIRILTFYPSRIPDTGGQKGTGSRIRIRNTDINPYIAEASAP